MEDICIYIPVGHQVMTLVRRRLSVMKSNAFGRPLTKKVAVQKRASLRLFDSGFESTHIVRCSTSLEYYNEFQTKRTLVSVILLSNMAFHCPARAAVTSSDVVVAIALRTAEVLSTSFALRGRCVGTGNARDMVANPAALK